MQKLFLAKQRHPVRFSLPLSVTFFVFPVPWLNVLLSYRKLTLNCQPRTRATAANADAETERRRDSIQLRVSLIAIFWLPHAGRLLRRLSLRRI